MSNSQERVDEDRLTEIRDPELSAFLAWLVPGLGHLYQRRLGKAALYFICIMGLFVYGLYLGSDKEVGWGRVVYYSWYPRRLPYLCQVGVGLPALPALIQANRMANDKPVHWNGFMAPPRPVPEGLRAAEGANAKQPSLHDLHYRLARYFELGTVYTMVAGLLNVLAIYDAWGGPVYTEARPKREEDDEDTEKSAESDGNTRKK
ncbi:MAG: DUF6677 family protein [Planctomycetota bacterium]